MKKIIMTLCLIVLATESVFAATMCAKNDTVTIVLDPSIAGTGYSYNTAQFTWWTWFPYGTIRGTAACLSSNYGKSFGAYVSNLTDNNEPVVGGETNGAYCWCKMTHPAVSRWVFDYTNSSDSDCAASCANLCGLHARNLSGLRSGLFGSARN